MYCSVSVYSEPQKVGTWFLEDSCWDSLYFTLRGHEDNDVPTSWLLL